jgi:DinB family protein
MADLQSTFDDNRQAVDAFIATAREVPAAMWTQPRGPKKWSPGQVTEHVAIVYEGARAVVNGTFKGPSIPRFVRPLIRRFAVDPILRTGRFRQGLKAPAIFQPTVSNANVDDLSTRLRTASGAFEAAIRSAAREGRTFVDHPLFGRVGLAEYTRLQAIHTRHHAQQLGIVTERSATV